MSRIERGLVERLERAVSDLRNEVDRLHEVEDRLLAGETDQGETVLNRVRERAAGATARARDRLRKRRED